MPTPDPPGHTLLLDVDAVARLAMCSARHIWRLCDRNEFPQPISIGRLKRWPGSAVVAWVEERSAAGGRRG